MRQTMQRAWSAGIASLVLGVVSSGCGGGDETAKRSASTNSSSTAPGIQAAAAAASAEQPQALKPGKPLRRYDKRGVTAVALSPDGTLLGVARSDGKVRLLDASSVADVSKFDIELDAIASGIAFSNDGRLLGVVGRDSDVHTKTRVSIASLVK